MSSHHAVWNRLLAELRRAHPDIVRAWFTGLELAALDRGVALIRVQNQAQLVYLDRTCRSAFAAAAQAATGRLITINFDVAETTPAPSTVATTGSVLRPDATFAQFVSGPGNRMALAAVTSAAEHPGETYNPLYLHGTAETGKSHLLHAFCHAISERVPALRWRLLGCEAFVREVMEATEQDALDILLHGYHALDAFVLDDLHELAGRERSQEAFFRAFNKVIERGGQVLMAGDHAPAAIKGLPDRLVSRLNSGLVVELEPPGAEIRAAILHARAQLRGIETTDEVVRFLAGREEATLSELEEALICGDALAQRRGVPLGVDLAMEALRT